MNGQPASKKQRVEKKIDKAEDESDPVVESYDVFLNRRLMNSLYLLQFPLRPLSRPYEADNDLGEPGKARMKPRQKKFELGYDLDLGSRHYDTASKAASIKQTHTVVSRNVPMETNYAVAAVTKDGDIVLNPLNAVCHMVPSFSYLDSLHPSISSFGDSKKGLDRDRSARTITQPRAQHPGNRSRRPSYQEIVQQSENEAYIDLDIETSKSSVLRNLTVRKKRKIDFDLQGNTFLSQFDVDYMKSKGPNAIQKSSDDTFKRVKPSDSKEETETIDESFFHGPIPREAILNMTSTRNQIRAIMHNAHVVSLSRIMELLCVKERPEENMIVRHLCEFAHYVHGVWVIQSKILYKHRAKFCRTLLIGLFSRDEDCLVSRKEWSDIAQLDFQTIEKILNEIAEVVELSEPSPKKLQSKESVWAKHGAGKYRRLKKANLYDDFQKRHKDVYKTQKQTLNKRAAWLEKELKKTRELKVDDPKERVKIVEQAHEIQLRLFFEFVFKTYGVCKWETVLKEFEKQKKEDRKISAKNKTSNQSDFCNISLGRCRGFLMQFSEKIGELFYQKDLKTQTPNFNKIRKHTANLLYSRRQIKRGDLDIMLRDKLDISLDEGMFNALKEEFMVAVEGKRGVYELKSKK